MCVMDLLVILLLWYMGDGRIRTGLLIKTFINCMLPRYVIILFT